VSTKELFKRVVLFVSIPLLPLSIGFLAVGITLMMLGSVRIPGFVFSVPTILSGVLIGYAGLCLKYRMRFMFAATFLILSGALLLYLDFAPSGIDLAAIWPVLMLFLGISFLAAGFLNYRSLHAVYVAPAFAFAALGFFFLLFSTHIITLSLTSIVLWWFPLLLVPSILVFVVWVFRKGRKDQANNG
jgi:hypothetical protein